jgi:hypothetical protein
MTDVLAVFGSLFAFLGLGALALVWCARRAGPVADPEPAGPPRPRPPDHVHTYRLRSSEEAAGEAVDVWRCDCGDIVRWVRAW